MGMSSSYLATRLNGCPSVCRLYPRIQELVLAPQVRMAGSAVFPQYVSRGAAGLSSMTVVSREWRHLLALAIIWFWHLPALRWQRSRQSGFLAECGPRAGWLPTDSLALAKPRNC